jgi:hypothetical protein
LIGSAEILSQGAIIAYGQTTVSGNNENRAALPKPCLTRQRLLPLEKHAMLAAAADITPAEAIAVILPPRMNRKLHLLEQTIDSPAKHLCLQKII